MTSAATALRPSTPLGCGRRPRRRGGLARRSPFAKASSCGDTGRARAEAPHRHRLSTLSEDTWVGWAAEGSHPPPSLEAPLVPAPRHRKPFGQRRHRGVLRDRSAQRGAGRVRGGDRWADRERPGGGRRYQAGGLNHIHLARPGVIGGDQRVLQGVPHADRRGGDVRRQRVRDSGLKETVVLQVLTSHYATPTSTWGRLVPHVPATE